MVFFREINVDERTQTLAMQLNQAKDDASCKGHNFASHAFQSVFGVFTLKYKHTLLLGAMLEVPL